MLTPHQQSFFLAGIVGSSFLYVSPLEQRKVISAENQLILALIRKMKFSRHNASRLKKYYLTSTPLSDRLIANK